MIPNKPFPLDTLASSVWSAIMGHLGRKRTFVLHRENSKLKIPIDLAGIATASYQWAVGDSDYLAAVAVACDRIRRVIHELKISDSKAIDRLSNRQERQETKLLKQQDEIKSIKVALSSCCGTN